MKPLTTKALSMITNAEWDTYAVKYPSSGLTNFDWSNTAYLEEKGISAQYTGNSACKDKDEDYCNDTILRTTSWIGLVGLMSVSDITYANGWLYNPSGTSLYPWSIFPSTYSDDARRVWNAGVGGAGNGYTGHQYGVWPSVYLRPDIKIIGGDGTQNSPCILK